MSDPKTFRDREFDSLVRESIEHTENAGQSSYAAERASTDPWSIEKQPTEAPLSTLPADYFGSNAGATVGGIQGSGFAADYKSPPNDTNGQAAQYADACASLEGGPFRGVAGEIRKANQKIFDALLRGDLQSAQDTVRAGLETIFDPYYISRGKFASTRLLRDLERSKSAPLTDTEITLFGGLAGDYAGRRFAREVEAEIDAAKRDGFSNEYIATMIVRALKEVRTGIFTV